MRKLSKKRCYRIVRQGDNTAHTVKGDQYNFVFSPRHNLWVGYDKTGYNCYQGSESALHNDLYWRVIKQVAWPAHLGPAPTIEDHKEVYEGEYEMNFEEAAKEALDIQTGVTTINGQVASKFTEVAILKMIEAERDKMAKLKLAVGSTESKYAHNKINKMNESIKLLLAELDTRV